MYDRRMTDRFEGGVTAFILAGGKSSRMGTDKAFLEFAGRTLLARALGLARSLTPEVRVVGDPAKFTAFAPVVEDVFPRCGPLAGIHAALRSSRTELNFILAVDMPFVSPALTQYLLTQARRADASATVPRSAEGWQPLCAVYRPSFADAAESALRAGNYKIGALFEVVPVQSVEEEELRQAGFSRELFRNLNTPAELELALKTKSEN
jgi:molybdopterin-guanine dinucleotide biosynthesis protein A